MLEMPLSERQVQGKLDQARAPQGVLNDTFSKLGCSNAYGTARARNAWNDTEPLAPKTKSQRERGSLGVRPVARIQTELIVGRVKARMIEEVEELRIEAQFESFAQFEVLKHASVEARLEGPAQYIATLGRESRL